jgi:hypothetical protein
MAITKEDVVKEVEVRPLKVHKTLASASRTRRLVRLVRLKPLAQTSRHPLLVQLQVESSLRTIFRRLVNLTWDQLLANSFQPRLHALFVLVIMGLRQGLLAMLNTLAINAENLSQVASALV